MKTKSKYEAFYQMIADAEATGYELGEDVGFDKGFAAGLEAGARSERKYIISIDNINPN